MFFISVLYITGTPTSLIFNQESELNQLHILKDCSSHNIGHELVPIVTMDPNGPNSNTINNSNNICSTQQQNSSGTTSTTVILPEVLDNVPQMIQIQTTTNPGLVAGISGIGLSGIGNNDINIGVYTLPEEPELEAEEN